jgi:WD40 repeat protein
MAKKSFRASDFFRRLKLATIVFFGPFILVSIACQKSAEIQAPSTELPGSTPLPYPTLPPTFTPSPTLPSSPTSTATRIPTDTPIPTPTIQFPLLAGTSLPFTPEPITTQNANRLINLLSVDLRDLTTSPGSDGSIYYVKGGITSYENSSWRDGVIAFTEDDTSLRLLAYKATPLATRPHVELNSCFQSSIGIEIKQKEYKNEEYDVSLLTLYIPDGKLLISNPQIPDGDALFFLLPDGNSLATQLFWDYCKFWFTDLTTGEQSKFFKPSQDDYGSRIGFTADGGKMWTGEFWYHNPAIRSHDFAQFSLYDLHNGQRSLPTRFDLSHIDLNLHFENSNDFMSEKYDLSKINDNLETDILAVSEDFLITAIHNPFGKIFRKIPFGGGYNDTGLYFARFDLWSLKDGVHLHTLGNPLTCRYQPSSEHTCLAALSADGKIMAIKSDDMTIQLHSTLDGDLIRKLVAAASTYSKLFFTSDGKMLVAMTDRSVELWSVPEGQFLVKLDIPSMLSHIAISHDSRYLATVTEDGLIQLWGLAP